MGERTTWLYGEFAGWRDATAHVLSQSLHAMALEDVDFAGALMRVGNSIRSAIVY